MRTKLLSLWSVMLFISTTVFAVDPPAFPGAEGAGKYTTGGRGGNVYFVTSLGDTNTGNSATGEGTLRWCLSQAAPRTVIFKVAGNIELSSNLRINSNTTIAGETAPGDGICIKNYPLPVPASCLTSKQTISCPSITLGGDNIIIRYIRIRPGDDIDNSIGAPLENIKFETDAIYGRYHSNIIIDHCSFSWGIDETASFYGNVNFTMQWCVIGESLRASFHPKGNHGYGGIWGGEGATFHHNLLAHHDSRNPRMCGSRYTGRPEDELVDFRNNVIYNWGGNSGYAGEGGSYNFVNNYYKYSGATSTKNRIFSPNADDGNNSNDEGVWGMFYVDGNYVNGYSYTTENNWDGIDPNTGNGGLPGGSIDGIKSTSEFTVADVTTETSEDAYLSVLTGVGASKSRDAADVRLLNEVEKGLAPLRASKGTTKKGLIDTPSDAGGYPTLTFDPSDVLLDSDYDGMPDVWEDANGLDKNDPSDRNDIGVFGYTMLEEYIYRDELSTAVIDTDVVVNEASVVPNPASGSARVMFNMVRTGVVTIELINISGQKELTIANNTFSVGENEVYFNASILKPGVYMCVIKQESGTKVIKVVVKN